MRSALSLPGLSINNIKSKIKAVIVNYDSKLNKILKSEKNGTGFTDEYSYPSFYSYRGISKWLSKTFPLSESVPSPEKQ